MIDKEELEEILMDIRQEFLSDEEAEAEDECNDSYSGLEFDEMINESISEQTERIYYLLKMDREEIKPTLIQSLLEELHLLVKIRRDA